MEKLKNLELLEKLLQLQPEIHDVNLSKGFWEQPNLGEKAVLIICEFAEAIEAHRERREFLFSTADHPYLNPEAQDFAVYFKVNVKDSLQDEIADAVIRLLDFTSATNTPLIERDYRKQSTGNFAEDVYRLIHYCDLAYHKVPGKDWSYVLAAIFSFCDWYNIDLLSHVQWKLAYNKTREHKHGKLY